MPVGGRPMATMRSDSMIASSALWVMNNTVLLRLLPDAQQLVAHGLARVRVERRERLVHQQHVRLGDQRAGEVHPLSHSARQLVRIVVGEILQPTISSCLRARAA